MARLFHGTRKGVSLNPRETCQVGRCQVKAQVCEIKTTESALEHRKDKQDSRDKQCWLLYSLRPRQPNTHFPQAQLVFKGNKSTGVAFSSSVE